MKPVIMIAGPTASGKSALAIRLAKRLGGEVINADSMQVYSDLRVISARPDVDEMEGVPHHLFGHVDGAVRYSVGAWIREAVPTILNCLARDVYPILVGGTGMYFKALTDGLAEIPNVPSRVLDQFKTRLSAEGYKTLEAEAKARDPIAAARLLGEDPQRLLRILSVHAHTGRALSDWQKNTRPVIPKECWHGIMLNPQRETLYQRINSRFEQMIEVGGQQEIETLLARDLPRDVPAMKAIGVAQSFEADGEVWISLCQRDTRRFAKRQMTYFRKYAHNWRWIERLPNIDTFEFAGAV